EERHARVQAAEARGRCLEAEPLEDRDDGGDEGLADQQLGAPPIVEERDASALARQQDGQSRARGTRADDRDSHRRILPLGVLGTASTTVNSIGTLYEERTRAQCGLNAMRADPDSAATSAQGTSPMCA